MIGKRMQKVREKMGLSVHESAKKLGIPAWVMNKIEEGGREPSEALISLFCLEYGINPHWLRSGEGAPCLTAEDAAEMVIEGDSGNTVRQIAITKLCQVDDEDDIDYMNGDSREDLLRAEHAYRSEFGRLRRQAPELVDELDDLAMELREAAERKAYEDGMKYGARIIYQLLLREDRRSERGARNGFRAQHGEKESKRAIKPNNGPLTRSNAALADGELRK